MKEDQTRINNNLRKYSNPMKLQTIAGPGRHSKVALNTGSTLEHELKKCEIAFKLIKEGRTIITEGTLKNGCRPDICILDLDKPMIYEIMKSEEMKSIKNKQKGYYDLMIIPIKV